MLSASRIVAAPVLSHAVLTGQYPFALATLAYCGFSDLIDGFLARKWGQESKLGSVIDPIGDKLIVGSLTSSLAYVGHFPVSLAVLILARDVGLLASGFYIRYRSLPGPFSWRAYFDLGLPSVQVTPTLLSKVNTALQMVLLGSSLLLPVLSIPMDHSALRILQWTVAGTTAWTGLSYILHHRQAVRYLGK